MSKRAKHGTIIPPEAWGPGAQIDWERSRLVAPDGTVYENIMINAKDVMRLFPPREDVIFPDGTIVRGVKDH